jgi:hypothetical protein
MGPATKEVDVNFSKAVFAGASALTLTALVLGAVRSHAATGPASVRITDVQISYHLAHPAGGQVIGSTEIVRQRLYNARVSKAAIGRASITCTFLDRRERSCTGTYTLPRGSLVVTGAIGSRLLYEIPIVGGTGIFDNARGTLTVTSTHLKPRREVLVFRLAG